MKKTIISIITAGLLALPCFGLVTQHTNEVSLVLADVCDGTFNDFSFRMSGYDDQKFVFHYDATLTGVDCTFRITKPIQGTIYLDVAYTDVTVSGTNVTFSIARTNIPPPGNYYGELLSYETGTTNVYRSLAQGKLPITWSLYLNETNYFNRYITNAVVGYVYVHPNWVPPLWITTNTMNTLSNYVVLKDGVLQTNINILSNFVGATYATGTPLYVYTETDTIATNALTIASNYFESSKLNTNDAGYNNLLTNTATKTQGTLADAAYPSSNPSNYVSAIVTNGLASTNWVIGLGYVTSTSTNGLASTNWVVTQNYYPSANPSNYVTAVITNDLASTNWVIGLGYVTDDVTNGLASTNWVVAQDYYPSSNPSNYITAIITNGLASTNYVASLNYVTATVTNGLASTNYVASLNYVTASVTNGLASTNWVAGRGYLSDLSGWSGTEATQQVYWTKLTSPYLTNLLLSCTNAEPDVTGVYTQVTDEAGYARWHNDNGYFVYVESAGGDYYRIATNGGGAPSGPAWGNGSTATADYDPFGGEILSTGRITATYSYPHDTWQAGYNSTQDCWQVKRNGVALQSSYAASNLLGTMYGYGAGITGITAAQVGAASTQNFISVSNQVEILNTNTATKAQGALADAAYPASNPSNYISETGATVYGLTNGSAYRGDWGNAVSGQVAVAVTNPAGSSVNMNGKDLTNAGTMWGTDLRVTGQSPTNGAVWLATNTAGQGKWSRPVSFLGYKTTDMTITSVGESNFVCNSIIDNIGGHFNGTSFTTPVNGTHRFVLYISFYATAPYKYLVAKIKKNGAVLIQFFAPAYPLAAGEGGVFVDTGYVYLTNGTIMNCTITSGAAATNVIQGAGNSFFSGALIREIP